MFIEIIYNFHCSNEDHKKQIKHSYLHMGYKHTVADINSSKKVEKYLLDLLLHFHILNLVYSY
jgi:hypothetical protein